MSSKEKPVVIVGAGIAGLTMADILARNSVPVVVLEREEVVGGLARSYQYEDFVFDIGPHRFHTSDPEVNDVIRDVLGSGGISIQRSSMVHFEGHYYQWPIQPWDLFHFPKSMAARIVADLMFNAFRSHENLTFEDYIVRMYGRTLFEEFFDAYTEKFIGLASHEVHRNWASMGVDRAVIDDRMKMRTLMDVVRATLSPRRPPELVFLYPTGGMQNYCDSLRNRIERNGGRVYCDSGDISLETSGDEVVGVAAGGRDFEPSKLIWTAPITLLTELLGEKVTGLDFLHILLFNVEVDVRLPQDFQWCYFGDWATTFNRISMPSRFDPTLIPAGKDGLCIEVTYTSDEERETYASQPERIVGDLLSVGMLPSAAVVRNVHIEDVRECYPIYRVDYLDRLKELDRSMERWTNIIPAGRCGKFWYNNMDHSIRNAIDVAEGLLREEK